MTRFMKFELVTFYILKVFGYICGILGAYCVIGFVGSLEHDKITCTQFLMYELHSFMLIGISYAVWRIRERIKEDLQKRKQILKRKRAQVKSNLRRI